MVTAVRSERLNPTTSDGKVNQPTTTEADNRRQSPTMHEQFASTMYDNCKSAYLPTVSSLAFDIQYGRQYQQSNNNRQ